MGAEEIAVVHAAANASRMLWTNKNGPEYK
jgi:hypothetical protein